MHIVNSVEPVGMGRSQPRSMFRGPAGFGRVRERSRSPWTENDLARLAELVADGTPIPDIANRLGRTQEAVRTKAYQLQRPVAAGD